MTFLAAINTMWKFLLNSEKLILLLIFGAPILVYYEIFIRVGINNTSKMTFVMVPVGGFFFIIASAVMIYKLYKEAKRRSNNYDT